LIPPFALFYFYVLFAAAFRLLRAPRGGHAAAPPSGVMNARRFH